MTRPRAFNEAKVVGHAMDVFWRYGYRNASFEDLEEATGLSRSSLFNAFGSKLDLFCNALDAYGKGPCRERHRALYDARGAEALRGYLDALGTFVRSPDGRRGCLMVSTSVGEPLHEDVTQATLAYFSGLRAAIRRAFAEGIDDGTIRSGLGAEEVADWFVTLERGVMAGVVSGEGIRALTTSIELARAQIGV